MKDTIQIGDTYHRISAISSFRADEEGNVSHINGDVVDYEFITTPGQFGRRPDGTQPPLHEAAKCARANVVSIQELIAAVEEQAASEGSEELES